MRDQDKENIENEPMELVPEETPAVKKKKVPAKKKADPAAPAGEQKKSAELKKAARPKKSGDRKKAESPEDSKKELKAEELMNGVRQLMDEAKAKDSKLDVDEINDFFADYHLTPDEIEQIYAYLEAGR